MSSAARQAGRLKDALTLDDLMLSDVEDNVSLGSPLQLISPQEFSKKLSGEIEDPDLEEEADSLKIKANYPPQDEDDFAPLPVFNKRKVDPRRQSTAIFSLFEATTSGIGLLGDSELAMGDEDMELLIPLAKSSAAMASKGISNLWVDPDMDDAILDEDLPEPSLEVMQAAAAAMPMASLATSPEKAVPVFNVRDSASLEMGFFTACRSSPGLDTVQEEGVLSPRAEVASAAMHSEAVQSGAAPSKSEQPVAMPPKQDTTDKPRQQPTVRQPSRLRLPSSSSSFFSHTTTAVPSGPNQPSRLPVSKSNLQRPVARAPQSATLNKKAEQVQSQAPAPLQHRTVVTSVPKPQNVPKAETILPASRTEPQKPAPRQPAPSRLPSSRLARPRQIIAPSPAAVASAPQETHVAEKRVLQKPKKMIIQRLRPVQEAAKTPDVSVLHNAVVAASSEEQDDTPRSAHLRWLEEHPELAFGGGAKIANSPEEDEEPRRKTAEERHYESWGGPVYSLNDHK